MRALKEVRYGVSFTVTCMGFLQTVVLRLNSGYAVSDLREVVKKAKEGIETEKMEMKERESILSQRASAEYTQLYEEAKEWIEKLEKRIDTQGLHSYLFLYTDFSNPEQIALTPIPDSEISSLCEQHAFCDI